MKTVGICRNPNCANLDNPVEVKTDDSWREKCHACGQSLDIHIEDALSPEEARTDYHHPMESVMAVPDPPAPKEDGGTGYAPEDDPKYRYRHEAEIDARDINGMLHRTMRACEFYMHLHRDKGGWQDYRKDYCWESIFRNLHEAFKEDRTADVMLEQADVDDVLTPEFQEKWEAQKREAMAELVGIINHVAILLDIFYPDEVEGLTDWLPLRDKLIGKDKSDGS